MAPGPLSQNPQAQHSSPSTNPHTETKLHTPSKMASLLETKLQEALASETVVPIHTSIYYQQEINSEFVNCHDRDRMVKWLCLLTHDFHYQQEVFFRATNILDNFLSFMKVRLKFLRCVTATCFCIAAKLEENSDAVESLLPLLVQGYSCEFSERDIQRMELIVMQKLDFKLTSYTPHDFLKMFHVVGVSEGSLSLPESLSPETHLCHITLCMEAIVCDHRLMQFRPSLVALAALGCDLKLLGCDWLSVVVTLQRLAKIRGGELSVCYEAVAPHYTTVAAQHPLYTGTVTAASMRRTKHSKKAPASDDVRAPESSGFDSKIRAAVPKCGNDVFTSSVACNPLSPVKTAA